MKHNIIKDSPSAVFVMSSLSCSGKMRIDTLFLDILYLLHQINKNTYFRLQVYDGLQTDV